MEIAKGTKILFSLIWTGIFLAAACLIVKGSKILDLNLGSYLTEKISMELIRQDSSLLEYLEEEIISSNPYVYFAFRGWPLADAVEPVISKNGVLVEYQEKYEKPDYSAVYGNGDFTIITGETYYEEPSGSPVKENLGQISKKNEDKISELKKNLDPNFLIKNFYVVDGTTSVDLGTFNVKKMLNQDFSIKKSEKKPQILIYHTHGSTERFADSIPGSKEESIIGVGAYLAEILETKYGYNVIHDETAYDIVNGKTDRNKAYNQALPAISKILKENPSIEVVIDLHRDGVSGKNKRVTVIDGKETAQIMFFNGLSRNKNGPIEYLENKNLFDNLAFSLQLKLKAMELYPNFTIDNYLKGYRYNQHLAKRSLLVEWGNQNNTLEEAKNAAEPFAEVLNQILE